MSKVNCLYHIVINTYRREMTIPEEHKHELYKYIIGIVDGHQSKILRINGIGNHIHILLDLHPTVALATMVQSIKQSSNRYMSDNPNFPHFDHWGKEYFAFSVSFSSKDSVINYICHQEEHHRGKSFEDEMKAVLSLTGMPWKDYLLT